MQPSPRNQILHNSRAGLSLVCFRWCMIWDTVFSLKLDCDVLAKLSLHRVSEWSERPQTCTRQGNTRVLSCWKRNRSNTHPHHAELSRRELAIFEPAMPSPSTHVAIATEPNLAQLPGWLVTGLLSLMHDLRHSVLRHFHKQVCLVSSARKARMAKMIAQRSKIQWSRSVYVIAAKKPQRLVMTSESAKEL